jgi:hypothetical protein
LAGNGSWIIAPVFTNKFTPFFYICFQPKKYRRGHTLLQIIRTA